tara:strand:- start:571 stop:798 length:228 start_codon:yes stop_codon:yes gene_type:complete
MNYTILQNSITPSGKYFYLVQKNETENYVFEFYTEQTQDTINDEVAKFLQLEIEEAEVEKNILADQEAANTILNS